MAYRGFFALNGTEIANSSRVIAHVGGTVPTSDYGFFGAPPDSSDCSLVESATPGLWEIPDSSVEVSEGLWAPPDGAARFGPGLFEDAMCWGSPALCSSCRTWVCYDDSWEGLREFLGDMEYRPELAPWYTTELPESGEFGGVWIMSATGFDSTPGERTITQAIGHGGIAGPHRDASRPLVFKALLIACSNAGVEFGLQWLTCLLRDTNDNTDTILRYLNSSPQGSGADPLSLLREAHGVVLTKSPEVAERVVTTSGQHQHANLYQITWEMAVLSPYSYLPQVFFDVEWDQITRQPINWVHAADCELPETCVDMPVMFSTECVPEEIARIQTAAPVCGGCMPVSGIDKYSFRVPTMDYAFRCRETAVSMTIVNNARTALTLQAFWRICGTDIRCEDNLWPLQVAGLPPRSSLYLDGITGRYKAWFNDQWHRPVGVVGTPNGAPWQPPIIDRTRCWDFVVRTASSSEFEVSMVLADREA